MQGNRNPIRCRWECKTVQVPEKVYCSSKVKIVFCTISRDPLARIIRICLPSGGRSILGWKIKKEIAIHSQVFLPGKSIDERAWRSYSPQSCKESDTTEQVNISPQPSNHTSRGLLKIVETYIQTKNLHMNVYNNFIHDINEILKYINRCEQDKQTVVCPYSGDIIQQ